MPKHLGRVLVIAGSDSGGGAGLQADIKTITALGGYAATAVTAITVQDTRGVRSVFPLPAELVLAQGRVVLEDIGADVLKLGMLGGPDVVEAAAKLIELGGAPSVVDPVITAKGGAALASDAAVRAIRERLAPLATLLTPNAPEAAALTGRAVEKLEDARRAATTLLEAGARAVLVKGGHIAGPRIVDLLVTQTGETRFEGERLASRHTHGTGCTLASAIATHLALGRSLEVAVESARGYLVEAIRQAPGFGGGHGPLGHGWPLRRGS